MPEYSRPWRHTGADRRDNDRAFLMPRARARESTRDFREGRRLVAKRSSALDACSAVAPLSVKLRNCRPAAVWHALSFHLRRRAGLRQILRRPSLLICCRQRVRAGGTSQVSPSRSCHASPVGTRVGCMSPVTMRLGSCGSARYRTPRGRLSVDSCPHSNTRLGSFLRIDSRGTGPKTG